MKTQEQIEKRIEELEMLAPKLSRYSRTKWIACIRELKWVIK